MTTSLHRILFGSLVLSDGTTERPMDTDYWFSVMGENFSTGQPEPITRTIETFMLDGAHVIKDGDGNRQMTCFVGIHGPDTQALTDGEVALTLETGKRNSFIVETHDGFGPPTLFEVVMSSFGQVPDDLAEVMRCERVFALNITALPQAFSTTVTVTPALTTAAVPATVTISDGTSATGWTSPDGAVSVVSGELVVPSSAPVFSQGGQTYDTWYATLEATKALSPVVDFSATQYVQADIRYGSALQGYGSYSFTNSVFAEVDGVDLVLMAIENVAGNDMTRATWLCTDTSASTLKIRASTLIYTAHDASPGAATLVIDNVKRTNVAPFIGTARQQTRSLVLPGSVRTPGTLMVSHPTAALGEVLVHTCFDASIGYSPAVSQFGSGGTTDTATVSGKRHTGTFTIDVPTSMLMPGSYALLTLARHTIGGGTVAHGWSAQARLNGTNVGASQSGTRSVTYVGSSWQIATLGTLELPASRMGINSPSQQRIVLTGSNVEYDEVWVAFLGDHLGNRGHLTIVSCGTAAPSAGGSSNRVFIKSATIDDPMPGVFVGTQADESDSIFAVGALWDQHEFFPEGTLVTTATTNAENAETSFSSRAAYHTHAGS